MKSSSIYWNYGNESVVDESNSILSRYALILDALAGAPEGGAAAGAEGAAAIRVDATSLARTRPGRAGTAAARARAARWPKSPRFRDRREGRRSKNSGRVREWRLGTSSPSCIPGKSDRRDRARCSIGVSLQRRRVPRGGSQTAPPSVPGRAGDARRSTQPCMAESCRR